MFRLRTILTEQLFLEVVQLFLLQSTPGFGFQPLILAGAPCFVSGGGTITSIEIGNPGSGYRVGVQTVQVGIITTNVGFSTLINIGTATVENGEIVYAITTSFFGSNLIRIIHH